MRRDQRYERLCEHCQRRFRASRLDARFCSDYCRKADKGGTCVDCGAATSYGTGAPSQRCVSCAQAASKVWTKEAIVAAIHRYAERYGQPRARDFNPALAERRGSPVAELLRQRFAEGNYPSATTVTNVFGTWNAAIEAAGFDTFDHGRDHDWRPGRPSRGLAA